MSEAEVNRVTRDVEVISKREVAEILGCTTKTVDRLVASKKIPHVILPTGTGEGTRVGFIYQAIVKWITGAAVDCQRPALAEGA